MMGRVLAGPKALPGFWIFMYYVSPFTYLVDGMLSTGLANTEIKCSDIELRTLQPAGNQNCSAYLTPYFDFAGGYLEKDEGNNCTLCPQLKTNKYLAALNSDYSHRWRNFAIMWGFIGFNVCAALFLYWLARVPKKQKVLDSPPTEQASRVASRVAKAGAPGEMNGAAKEIHSEKEEGIGEVHGGSTTAKMG